MNAKEYIEYLKQLSYTTLLELRNKELHYGNPQALRALNIEIKRRDEEAEKATYHPVRMDGK